MCLLCLQFEAFSTFLYINLYPLKINMLKKLSSFLWGVLCICLLNCYNHKATTIQGVTYTMEEEEEVEVEKYANHRYYPLLEFIQQWEDFHDETISDWINYYDKDDAFP